MQGRTPTFGWTAYHKSLPALTQGALVSAKTPALAEALAEAADIFRTTSPSYPIMASVEYAVKYPRNTALENAVLGFVRAYPDKIRFGGGLDKALCRIRRSGLRRAKIFRKKGYLCGILRR